MKIPFQWSKNLLVSLKVPAFGKGDVSNTYDIYATILWIISIAILVLVSRKGIPQKIRPLLWCGFVFDQSIGIERPINKGGTLLAIIWMIVNFFMVSILSVWRNRQQTTETKI